MHFIKSPNLPKSIFSGLINFLVDVSGLVDAIWIGASSRKYNPSASSGKPGYEDRPVQPLPFSLVMDILSRKCTHLHVSDSATKATTGQVQEILKVISPKYLKKTAKCILPVLPNQRKEDIAGNSN